MGEGIWVAGGAGGTGLLEAHIREQTGLKVNIMEDPAQAVASGLMHALKGAAQRG